MRREPELSPREPLRPRQVDQVWHGAGEARDFGVPEGLDQIGVGRLRPSREGSPDGPTNPIIVEIHLGVKQAVLLIRFMGRAEQSRPLLIYPSTHQDIPVRVTESIGLVLILRRVGRPLPIRLVDGQGPTGIRRHSVPGLTGQEQQLLIAQTEDRRAGDSFRFSRSRRLRKTPQLRPDLRLNELKIAVRMRGVGFVDDVDHLVHRRTTDLGG